MRLIIDDGSMPGCAVLKLSDGRKRWFFEDLEFLRRFRIFKENFEFL